MTFTATTMRQLMALGLPQDKLDAVLAIFEEARAAKSEAKGTAKDKAKRGTRLAENWAPPEDWVQWAIGQGLRRDEAMRQAQRFRDWWLAAPGAKGIKLDWFATWRTWIGKECEKLGRVPVAGAGAVSASDPASFTAETWEAILMAYKRSNNWNPAYGPAPGRLKCKCPPALIQKILR